MKKTIATLILVMGMGMPFAHGLSLDNVNLFGGLVSNLAKSGPGAVAEHVSNK